jgi:hypothetical protein
MLKMLEQYNIKKKKKREWKKFCFISIYTIFFSFQKNFQNYKRQKTHIKK